MVKILNFICGGKIKLWGKFSGICQVKYHRCGEKKKREVDVAIHRASEVISC